MALPRVASTVFTHKTLDGKTIHYRPYRMGDEQALLEARQSENDDVKVQTILNILQGLVINKVDITKLPTFEVEHLLLSTRIVSVGNESNTRIKCAACGEYHPVTLDLSTAYLKDTRPESYTVPIGEEEGTGEPINLVMKYPTFESLTAMKSQNKKNIIRLCVESVSVGESYTDFEDVSDEDIDEWLMSLSREKLNEVYAFLEAIPKLRLDVQFTCKCGKENEFTLDDFESFFT